MEIEMYQLEIDYEMVGPEYQYFEELKQWVKIAFEAGALRVAIWQSDQNGNNQRVVKTFWV
jgi:hypothetical protein